MFTSGDGDDFIDLLEQITYQQQARQHFRDIASGKHLDAYMKYIFFIIKSLAILQLDHSIKNVTKVLKQKKMQ